MRSLSVFILLLVGIAAAAPAAKASPKAAPPAAPAAATAAKPAAAPADTPAEPATDASKRGSGHLIATDPKLAYIKMAMAEFLTFSYRFRTERKECQPLVGYTAYSIMSYHVLRDKDPTGKALQSDFEERIKHSETDAKKLDCMEEHNLIWQQFSRLGSILNDLLAPEPTATPPAATAETEGTSEDTATAGTQEL